MPGHFTRRDALQFAAAMFLIPSPAKALKPRFAGDPFKLGVASGDPTSDGVVLWTRLAPFPFEPRAVDPIPYHVAWRVATDDAMKNVVASGTGLAMPELAHSVHVEVERLEPRTDYFYQFSCGGYESPIGHTRTSPRPGDAISRVRFAHASCQSYTDGYFVALRDMAGRDLDFILHLGDYIYESPYNDALRRIPVPEARDLWGYRALHAQYKLDPDLRAAHAACPWFATWDDHEVANDWNPSIDTERKKAAFQAYYEHMPLRLSARPGLNEMRMYSRATWGDLLELNILDTRQYRSLPACLDQRWVSPTSCPKILDESRTLLGAPQEHWLLRGLGSQKCKWTVLGQPSVFAPLDMLEDEGLQLNQDSWDGTFATRQRILNTIRDRKITNAISLGGEIHSFYAGHVPGNALDPKSPPLMTEIVATSISAGGGGEERQAAGERLLRAQPFATYWENRYRGYVLNEVTPASWSADLRFVNDVRLPTSNVRTGARLQVESGRLSVGV